MAAIARFRPWPTRLKLVGEDGGILRPRTQPGMRSHEALRPDCSSFTIYGPLEAALPFVLPNKLAPDFQVSQGLGKHLSRLVPHFVFVSVQRSGLYAQICIAPGLGGEPPCSAALRPQLQAHQGGVSPSTKSPASLHHA